MDTLLVALAGALAGAAAMALPGVHVNALALALLALAPGSGGTGAAFLVGAFAGAPFGLALSSTYFGGGDEDGAPAARKLALEGRGAESVALQCWGAFAGLALAIPLAMLARPALLLVEPRLSDVMPWLLAAILVALVVSETARPPAHLTRIVVPRGFGRPLSGVFSRDERGWRIGRARVRDPDGLLDARDLGSTVHAHVAREWREGWLSRPAGWALAAGLLAISGALGLVALRVGARPPIGLPASALLPLLAGLFAAPGLVLLVSARRGAPRIRLRVPRPRGLVLGALPGAAASALLGLAPGVSASHVAQLARRAQVPERRLVTLGAVNGGAVVFALLAWHALGKARAGALVAAQALEPAARWRGLAPTQEILLEAALVLAAAGFACLVVRGASGGVARLAASVRPATLAFGGLALVTSAVALTCGAWGLAVLAAGACVGMLPIRLGMRRSLLMGCILVPAALRAWGLG